MAHVFINCIHAIKGGLGLRPDFLKGKRHKQLHFLRKAVVCCIYSSSDAVQPLTREARPHGFWNILIFDVAGGVIALCVV